MSNPNKHKGDAFEVAVQHHHHTHGFPWTEKTRAGYERDHGDLHPVPARALTVQCKNVRAWNLSAWIAQLAQQIANAGADHGYLVVKRPRVSDPGQAYVVTTLDAHLLLLRAAGYGEPLEADTREPAHGQPIDGAA